MPDEWNAMVASMRAHKEGHPRHKGEMYCQPQEDEISEPEKFMSRPPTDAPRLGHLRKQEPQWLKAWKMDAEHGFTKLHAKFNKLNRLPDPEEEWFRAH